MLSKAKQPVSQVNCYTQAVREPVFRPYPNPTFEWAAHHLDRGYAVVPVPFRKKRPMLKGWQKLEIAAETLKDYFKAPKQNIGVILGEQSGWLVDVDLDSPEAVKLADFFLPQTASKFGRKSKPSSHRLFLCKDAKYVKFTDPVMLASKNEDERKGSCIVEIRTGNGKQTIFPPSVHVSGETIGWVSAGAAAEVSFAELDTSAGRLAAASLLLKYWRKGIQHDLALAMAGMLLRHGWNTDDTKSFIRGICLAAHDDELDDRLTAVDSTAKAIADGQNVTGIPTLIELTDQKVVNRICKWLGIIPGKNGAAAAANRSREDTQTKVDHPHSATLFDGALTLEVVQDGKKDRVTARTGNTVIGMDVFNLAESVRRTKFVKTLAGDFDDDQKTEILRALLSLADEPQPNLPGQTEASTYLQTSFKELSDGRIIEQICAGFAVYDPATGDYSIEPSVTDMETVYEPVDDDLLKKGGGIYMAEGLEEYGTEAELDAEIEKYVSEYLDLKPLQLKLTAKYIRFTYIFDKSLELSYLNPTGDMGSGKSRYGLTSCLASRRGLPLVNPSAASLFRIVNQYHPTLFIDEANFAANTDDTSAIIQVLNAGFQVTGKIPRQKATSDGGFVTEMFDPFCPKIIGSLKKSASTALNSRCIEIQMEATRRNDIPLRLAPKLLKDAARIRNMLTLWRLRNLSTDFEAKFERAEKELRTELLPPRTIQISIPLYALIDDTEVKRDFIELLKGRDEILNEERRSSFDGELIQAIHTILFDTDENGVITWQIERPSDLEVCEELRTEQLASMLSSERSGKNEINTSYLGRRINGIGLRSKQILRRSSDYRKKTAVVFDPLRLRTLFQNNGLPVPKDLSSDHLDQECKSNTDNDLGRSKQDPATTRAKTYSDHGNSNDFNNNGGWSERPEHISRLIGESEDERDTREERKAIQNEHLDYPLSESKTVGD